jgi:predicted enzyme related to lactoylglutathione lyase
MDRNIICWFEIYVNDLERAKKFYSQVLNLNIQDMPTPGEAEGQMKMASFCSFEEVGNGVSGALIEMAGTKEGDGKMLNTIVYFPCEDCEIEQNRVEAAGGKIHQPKMSIGEHGFCAICVDSEGNFFGLYSMQ